MQCSQQYKGTVFCSSKLFMPPCALGLPRAFAHVPYFPDYRSHSIMSCTPISACQSLRFKIFPQLDQETTAYDSSLFVSTVYVYACLTVNFTKIPEVSRISIVSRSPFFTCEFSCKKGVTYNRGNMVQYMYMALYVHVHGFTGALSWCNE